jgi:membrane fusion protein, multidrug efflux system
MNNFPLEAQLCPQGVPASRWRLIAPALVLGLACFTAGCGSQQSTKAAPRPAAAVSVAIDTVAVRDVPVYGEFIGQTEAKDTVNVVPRVNGYLEKVNFVEGSHIHKGDALFQIERASYETTLASAEAKLAQDQASLDKYLRDIARLTPLVREQAATQQDLDAALAGKQQMQAALRGDQASIDMARLNLQYTSISSPIDGIVGRLGVTQGNYVTAGQAMALAVISSFDPIYVSFSVPESKYLDLARKHPAGALLSVPVTLTTADGQTFPGTGKLDFVDRTADSQTGTVGLRARFANSKAILRPGQFARVRFLMDRRAHAVLIPKQAIVQTLAQQSVLVVSADNKAVARPVTTGGEFEDFYICASGLTGGERIVVEGTQKVRSGSVVKQVPPTPKGAR